MRCEPSRSKVRRRRYKLEIHRSKAATYQNAARLTYRLDKYVDDLAEFDGATWGTDVVKSSDIGSRTLNLVIPKGSMTAVQRDAIEAARIRALSSNVNPVKLVITQF